MKIVPGGDPRHMKREAFKPAKRIAGAEKIANRSYGEKADRGRGEKRELIAELPFVFLISAPAAGTGYFT